MKKFADIMAMLLLIVIPCLAQADSAIDMSGASIDERTVNIKATCAYDVRYKDLDFDLICSTFLGDDCQYERNDVYGIWYTCKYGSDTKRLGFFDQESAMPSGNGFDGGFVYSVSYNDVSYNAILGHIEGGKYGLEPGFQDEGIWQNSLNKELSFCDVDEAISSSDEIMSSIGLDSFRCIAGYGFEKDTVMDSITPDDYLNSERLAHYADVLTDCYVLFYRQYIDELPVNDTIRSNKLRGTDDPFETYATVIFSQSGIEYMYVVYAYDVTSKNDESTEYELESALDIIEEKLNKGLRIESFQVENISKLLYPIGKVSTGISLRPVWCVSGIDSSGEDKNYIIDTLTLETYE